MFIYLFSVSLTKNKYVADEYIFRSLMSSSFDMASHGPPHPTLQDINFFVKRSFLDPYALSDSSHVTHMSHFLLLLTKN